MGKLLSPGGFVNELHKKINELKNDNIALTNKAYRMQALYNRTKEAYEYVAHLADEGGLMKQEHHERLVKILRGDDAKEA